MIVCVAGHRMDLMDGSFEEVWLRHIADQNACIRNGCGHRPAVANGGIVRKPVRIGENGGCAMMVIPLDLMSGKRR